MLGEGAMSAGGRKLLRSQVTLIISLSEFSLVAQMVNDLPVMQETWVRSLGWEDPLEKGMATHSSTLAWKTPGQRSLVGYSP